ncbi:hypothetical protein ACHAXA_009896 [Cyclostephanos tholiformis]|uniref:PHD-type domain-containing protein n=1 Tax=Cyclostephanos tholiformis TaxID=382380 RepID=A0ABD3RWA2_9STRA
MLGIGAAVGTKVAKRKGGRGEGEGPSSSSSSSSSSAVDAGPPTSIARRHDDDATQSATNATTKTTDVASMKAARRVVGRNRRPPERYVARPSKSGWGVKDGDLAFLSGGYGIRGWRKEEDDGTADGGKGCDLDGVFSMGEDASDANTTKDATITAMATITNENYQSPSNGVATIRPKNRLSTTKSKRTSTTGSASAARSSTEAPADTPSAAGVEAAGTPMANRITNRKRMIEVKTGASAPSENRRRRTTVAAAVVGAGGRRKSAPVSGRTDINANDDGTTVPAGNDAARCAVLFERHDLDDNDVSNEYDDVACCLCKCAVDFSDKSFFAKPSNSNEDVEDDDVSPTEPIGEDVDECTSRDGDGKSTRSIDAEVDNDKKHSVLLPYRFYDPGNALILCDGPAHAKARKRGNDGKGQSREEYRCDRAYHQRCHFVPVLSIPRGPWRCLICRYRDEDYNTKERASRKVKGGSSGERERVTLTDSELNAIFRCVPICPPMSSRDDESSMVNRDRMEVVSRSDEEEMPSVENCKTIPNAESSMNPNIKGIVEYNEESSRCTDIAPDKTEHDYKIVKLERRFEALSAHMKAHLLHAELTVRSRGIIKSSLSTIRTAEHSLRSITETAKARKALAERIESQELGLPQELCQCVMRIAASKMRVRELILNLECVIRAIPQRHDVSNVIQSLNVPNPCTAEEDMDDGTTTDVCDPISELMKWYLQQSLSGTNANKEAHVIDATTATAADAATLFDEMKINDNKIRDSLLYLFPEGTLKRRRHEPRTGEAHINKETRGEDDSCVTSISLDDLVCWNCHGSHATDENDMILCDGIGCYRSFHMKCVEPQLSYDDVHKNTSREEDDDWFCPLCTATANLTHFAQMEYLGDDYWESPSNKRQICDNNINGKSEQKMKEWENAKDVFPEATFELRVAQKMKDNIRDEEMTTFLAQSLGIFTGSLLKDEKSESSNDNHFLLSEEDESDDDYDHEALESLDDESFAEDRDMERQLVKEKIGKEELDALSVTSSDGSDSSGGDNDIDSRTRRPRRSKRKKFPLSKKIDNGDDDTSSDTNVAVPPLDVGTVDIANILRGKRRRTQVDYRKLADVMFGDESDDEAKGAKKEYTFKPKVRGRRGHRGRQQNSDEDDGDDVDGDCSESDTNSNC